MQHNTNQHSNKNIFLIKKLIQKLDGKQRKSNIQNFEKRIKLEDAHYVISKFITNIQ